MRFIGLRLLAITAALTASFAFAPLTSRSTRTVRANSSPSSSLRYGYYSTCTCTTRTQSTQLAGSDTNLIYDLLATPADSPKPNCCNFFYNDEVMSHLHGYMLLVGLFAAQDVIFLAVFCLLAGVAATSTNAGILPPNPRVPAVVAATTLILTLCLRLLLVSCNVSLPVVGAAVETTTMQLAFEVGICTLNILWGVAGSWRTKEKVDGATFGF